MPDTQRLLDLIEKPKNYKCPLHGAIGFRIIDFGGDRLGTGPRCGLCYVDFIKHHVPAAEPIDEKGD